MAVRIALFLLIGLGLAGIAVAGFIGLRPGTAPMSQAVVAPVVIQTTQILAAARVIRGGTLLLPDDVTSKAVAPNEVPPGAWIDNLDTRAATQGSMVRHQIEPGGPILHDDIVRPGERGFLAAVLKPGARAATIAVDAVSGTAGLIWPADRVDVILTQKLDDATAPLGRRVVGETVLRNVRVIAVDQHMTEGVAPLNTLTNTAAAARTVTIEVMAQDAEKISVAVTLGRLALVVRSASDQAQLDAVGKEVDRASSVATGDKLVWSSDVSGAFRAPSHGGDQTVHLFTGTQAAPVEYHY